MGDLVTLSLLTVCLISLLVALYYQHKAGRALDEGIRSLDGVSRDLDDVAAALKRLPR